MKFIRTVDSAGNHQDREFDHVPSIGELIELEDGRYVRVKDVLHNLQNAPGQRIAILLDEETNMEWPE